MWIWLTAKILINILNTLGLVLNIPDTFLALTLLSIGNSAGGDNKNYKIFIFKKVKNYFCEIQLFINK